MSVLLTTAEVAQRWGCTQRMVQALCKSGRLKAELKGKTYLVRERVAENYEHQPRGRPSRNGTHKSTAAKRGRRKRPLKSQAKGRAKT